MEFNFIIRFLSDFKGTETLLASMGIQKQKRVTKYTGISAQQPGPVWCGGCNLGAAVELAAAAHPAKLRVPFPSHPSRAAPQV